MLCGLDAGKGSLNTERYRRCLTIYFMSSYDIFLVRYNRLWYDEIEIINYD